MKVSDVKVCVECDEVFAGRDACPSCMCTVFLILSSVLPPMMVRSEIDAIRSAQQFVRERVYSGEAS